MKICCFQHEPCDLPRAKSHSYCHAHRVDYERMRIYDLTWEELQYFKDAAICEGCGEEFMPGSLFIDHCHKTGKVRGALCSGCNLVAGQIESEKGQLLIKYLELKNEN